MTVEDIADHCMQRMRQNGLRKLIEWMADGSEPIDLSLIEIETAPPPPANDNRPRG